MDDQLPDKSTQSNSNPPANSETPPQNASRPEQTKSSEEPIPSSPPVENFSHQTAPVAQPQPSHPPVNAGVIVLQWLTYAFWGWLILGMIWLTYVILVNFIMNRQSIDDAVPYAIASTLVLLPIAFVCDYLYRKHETVHKAGAAMVIMVIHAVIFALFGIGALITAVFTGISVLISGSFIPETHVVIILTAIVATILYAAAFLRTLNPFKNQKIAKYYGLSMLGLTVLLIIFAVFGPVLQTIASRGDRIIEDGLPKIQRAIGNYADENKKLPESLKDLSINDENAQHLIEKGLVEYKLEKKSPATLFEFNTLSENDHRYQLCVEYKKAKGYADSYADRYSDTDNYTSYISTSSHKAGRQCYKLMEYIYNPDQKDGVSTYSSPDIKFN